MKNLGLIFCLTFWSLSCDGQSNSTEALCKDSFFGLLTEELIQEDILVSVKGLFEQDTVQIVISNFDLYYHYSENNLKPRNEMISVLQGRKLLKIDNAMINEVQMVRKWKHLEKRIRRMEDKVTSREYDWNSRFHG